MKSITIRVIVILIVAIGNSLTFADEYPNRKIEIDGYPIEYVVSGEGAPILFLHGAISDMRLWEPYIKLVSEKRKFVAYTQRYHGTNHWPDEAINYSRDQHVSDLISFIEEIELQPVDIVSYSYSGGVALQAMLQRPDLFKSGIHYEPAMADHLTGEPGFGHAVSAFRSGFGPMVDALKAGEIDDSALRFAEAVFGMKNGEIAKLSPVTQQIFSDNGRTVPPFLKLGKWAEYDCEDLSKIQIPNLVIQGSDTHVYFSMTAESLSECLSNSLLLTMDGADHSGAGIKIEKFGEIVMRFAGLID